MIYLRILLATISLSLDLQAATSAGGTAPESKQLFKIGFEFQESHHMCPWAVKSPGIQTKPIFSVCQGERVLWDLTIDWQDLEFVTMPIENNEMDILKSTMFSIKIACDTLVDLNEKSESVDHADITFSMWINGFTAALKKNQASSNSNLFIKVHSDIFLNPLDFLSFGSFHFPVDPGKRFDFQFQPQVTIQHHLCDSVNLCLGLLVNGIDYGKGIASFDTSNSGARYLDNFIKSTKLFTQTDDSTEVSFPVKFTSQHGFLLLHMLTCIDLSHERPQPSGDCGELNLTVSTPHTQNLCLLHSGSGQVNAKSSVNFLSRRPFSSMWKDIASDQNYAEFLRGQINKEFLADFKEKFDKMNYGEIFFTEEGERMDLRECLFSNVYKDTNIQFLLGQGILSLEFIRILRVSFLHNYFKEAVKSVSSPKQTKRCVFDKTAKTLKLINTEHDILSPPHLSSEKDSMGAFKDDSKHDTKYGEAVVEVRMIASIPQSALSRINKCLDLEDEPQMKNRFLSQDFSFGSSFTSMKYKNDDYDLHVQTKGLFLYIEQLLIGGYDE